jgi:hypothetical protein
LRARAERLRVAYDRLSHLHEELRMIAEQVGEQTREVRRRLRLAKTQLLYKLRTRRVWWLPGVAYRVK